jgi:hypothetical protein
LLGSGVALNKKYYFLTKRFQDNWLKALPAIITGIWLAMISGCDDRENVINRNIHYTAPICEIDKVYEMNQKFTPDSSVFFEENIQTYLEEVVSSNKTSAADSDIKFELIDTRLTQQNKFRGAAVYNGIIFMFPQTPWIGDVHVFNPKSDYLCRLKSEAVLSGVWGGGVSLPDGRIIALPIQGNQVLEVKPATLDVKVILKVDGTYGGGVRSGKFIYGVPYNANHILRIDTEDYRVKKIGEFRSGGEKWYSSAVDFNGVLYGIPLSADNVLRIHPETDNFDLIGNAYQGNLKWAGSVITPSGEIYGIPDDATTILEIKDGEVGTVGEFPAIRQKWSFGFLGPDGLVYMMPDYARTVMQFDPKTKEVQHFGDFLGDDKWNGVVLVGGDYYAIPDSSRYILKVKFQGFNKFADGVQSSPHFNKY